MTYSRCLRCALAALIIAGFETDMQPVAHAQVPQAEAASSGALTPLAQQLKENLEAGSLMLADLHAIKLRLLLNGASADELSSVINQLEQRPPIDRNDPSFTVGLVPVADNLIEALDKQNLALARRYAEQLARQIHAQYEIYIGKQIVSSKTGDIDGSYFTLSLQLQDSLRSGDLTNALIFAVKVQNAQDAIVAQRHRPAPLNSRNIYNINDAFGRAALVHKDYLAAGDYLLKASDTPGKDPTLRSFGPDMWLAEGLLKAGYKDVVLTFLERCSLFWDPPRLNQWIVVLRNGGEPDLTKQVYSHDPAVF